MERYFTKIRMEFFIVSAPIFEALVETTSLILRGNLSSPAALRERRQLLDELAGNTTRFMEWQWSIEPYTKRLLQAMPDSKCSLEGAVCNVTHVAGTCKSVEILSNRLHVALGGEDAYPLEMSSREAALLFEYNLAQKGPAGAAVLEVHITKAVAPTTKDWTAHAAGRHGLNGCDTHNPFIAKDVYLRWLSAMNVTYPAG